MATPMVSGAVALIKQAHPDWTPEQIKESLKLTAKDIGLEENTQGAGRIDLLEAIQPISISKITNNQNEDATVVLIIEMFVMNLEIIRLVKSVS